MSKDIDEQKLKQILDGVWHSRRVDDVVPEIMALIAAHDLAKKNELLEGVGENLEGMCANHRQMAVVLDYTSPEWAKKVPCDHYAGRNIERARLRTVMERVYPEEGK